MIVNSQITNSVPSQENKDYFIVNNQEERRGNSFIDSFSRLVDEKILEERVKREEPQDKKEVADTENSSINKKDEKSDKKLLVKNEEPVIEKKSGKKAILKSDEKLKFKDLLQDKEVKDSPVKKERSSLKDTTVEDIFKNSVLINSLIKDEKVKVEHKKDNKTNKIDTSLTAKTENKILDKIKIIDKREQKNSLKVDEHSLKTDEKNSDRSKTGRDLKLTKNFEQKDFNLEKNITEKNVILNVDLKEADGKNFTKNDIASAIHRTGIKDIVTQTKILLKNDNKGEIKIILRPEDLGTVKIKLFLENKFMVGKIYVENSIIKDAFASNMLDLKQQFLENGINVKSLELISVDVNSNQSNNNFYSDDNQDGKESFFVDYQQEENLKENFVDVDASTNLSIEV